MADGFVKVLEALGDGCWRTPGEIAGRTGDPVELVRARLREMAGEGLVERGGWGDSQRWGEWRITGEGAGMLSGSEGVGAR